MPVVTRSKKVNAIEKTTWVESEDRGIITCHTSTARMTSNFSILRWGASEDLLNARTTEDPVVHGAGRKDARKTRAPRNYRRGRSSGSSLWSRARSRWHCATLTSAITYSNPQHDRVTAKWQVHVPSRTPSTRGSTLSSGRASGVSSTRTRSRRELWRGSEGQYAYRTFQLSASEICLSF